MWVKNTPWETNSLSAPFKLATIGSETAEGIAACRIMNNPNNEKILKLNTPIKKNKGKIINFKPAASLISDNLPKNPFNFILANQQPKIIAESTKLVSPTIFKGEVIKDGISLNSPV